MLIGNSENSCVSVRDSDEDRQGDQLRIYAAQARTARPSAKGEAVKKGAQDREGRFTMWALRGWGIIWKLTQTGYKAGRGLREQGVCGPSS